MADAERVAEALHARYATIRAITLIARVLMKALFAGRADEVLFWAVVHAHYRGAQLSETTEAELTTLRELGTMKPKQWK